MKYYKRRVGINWVGGGELFVCFDPNDVNVSKFVFVRIMKREKSAEAT